MRKSIKYFLWIIHFVIILSFSEYAPAQRFPRQFNRAFNQISVEAITLPSDRDSVGILNLLIVVKQDFFVFVKSNRSSIDSAYHAAIEISTDIYDEKENLVQSRNSSRHLFIQEEQMNSRRIDDVDFIQSCLLHFGTYKVVIRASDEESQREESFPRYIQIKSSSKTNPAAWTLLPLNSSYQQNDIPQHIEALGIGGDILFTKKPFFAFQYQGDSSAHIQFTIQKRSFKEEFVSQISYSAQDEIKLSSSVLRLDSASGQFRYNIIPSLHSNDQVRIFSLPLDTLDAGQYRLNVVVQQSGKTDSLVHEFRIVWKDMPRSLFNLQYAIEAMRYILTDAQLDSMLSGSPEEQQQKFHTFWKKKDPTPNTIWNEYLVEYFRRVDEATEKYRTIKTDNGAFTDRGRIHILFGEPEQIDRVLPPGEAPQEIWLYPSLKKKFIFVDPSRNGSYYLKVEEKL